MLRNLISKLPVIATSTEHGVSSACNVRTLRNVSPMRNRSSSNSKCSNRTNSYSLTAVPQIRRSLSLPRPSDRSLYEYVESRGLDEACRGFCQSRDGQDHPEKYASERKRERVIKRKSDVRDFEVGSTYYEPTEQYELEAAQPRQNRDVRTGADVESLRKSDLRLSEKRSETDAIQPANLKPFGSQDNMFFVSLFKPSSNVRYPTNEYSSTKDVDISDQIETDVGANTNIPQYDKSQNRKYSTVAPRLIDQEVDKEKANLKIIIPSKTSLNEKRKTEIEDYIYQRYKPQNKRNEKKTEKSIANPPREVESTTAVNGISMKSQGAISEENFAKTFSGGLQQRKVLSPEKLPAKRGLSGISYPSSKSQTILSNAEKQFDIFKATDLRKFAMCGSEDVCDKKRKKPPRVTLEPQRCREPEPPEHLRKVLLPSKVKLKVHPCLMRPDYVCPQKPKCPPRADDCKEYVFKPLPKLEAKTCECVPEVKLKEGPRLKRLNLRLEAPPRSPCPKQTCLTPRADDNKPLKKKKLKLLEAKDCPCVESPPMVDVKLARLGPCKEPEVCRPPRKCPPKKICPPRADDGLEVCPKVLPFIDAKPCPCIEDPPLKDVKVKRLNLKIPDQKRHCPPVKVCPPRADDNYVIKPKKLQLIEPGDCPCVDHPMTDVNFRRLKCKEIEYKCIVPDPCKVTPRADWGCWEYEQWECKEVDPECIEPPPCTSPKPCKDKCRKNPCHNTGTRDILNISKNTKRNFNTDSRHSDTSIKLKLFHQLKSRTSKNQILNSRTEGECEEVTSKRTQANIPATTNSDTAIEKTGVAANTLLLKQQNTKNTEQRPSTPHTVLLIEKLSELEKKKPNPLLFNPIENNKLSVDKIRLVTERMRVNPEFQSNSTVSVMSTRQMSTENKCGKGECSKKGGDTKVKPKSTTTSQTSKYPARAAVSAPSGTRTKCDDPKNHPCTKRPPPPGPCTRQNPPYPCFAESVYGEIAPFTFETQWRYDGVNDDHYHQTVKQTKSSRTGSAGGIGGGKREYSTRAPSAPSNKNDDVHDDNSRKTARPCKNPRTCHATKTPKDVSPTSKCDINKFARPCYRRGAAPCRPVFKLENCPDLPRDPVCSSTSWKRGPQPCEPKPKSPFPSFSEIITEEIEDTISVCPVDKHRYRQIQPAYMEPVNRFGLSQPIFPGSSRVHHEWEKICRGEDKLEEPLNDCYAEREDVYTNENIGPPSTVKKKFSRAKKVPKNDSEIDQNKRHRKFSTASSLYLIQARNFSSVKYSTRFEENQPYIDFHSRENTLKLTRRMYIRNYSMFCKNPNGFHDDIDERIKDLTEKHLGDPDTTCKYIKLKNVNWRVKNFKKYEKLNKYKNVPSNIKRFYRHSKSKYRVHSTEGTFCAAINTINNTTQNHNLYTAMIRGLSTNMSLAKAKKSADVHPEILQKIEGKKKYKLETKKKFKKTASMLKLDQKPCCPPPEPKPQPSNPNIQLDPDSQFSSDFSPCQKTPPCPKFRLSNCPEKSDRKCKFKTPKAYPPCTKRIAPYKSFAECNTGNVMPDQNTECPFLRENMKEILQPRYPILPETTLDFTYPRIERLDAHFELDYIQRRLGLEKGISQNCETFGSCLSTPRCSDFEPAVNKPCKELPPRPVGQGCDPEFKITPCGPEKKEAPRGGKGNKACKVPKAKCPERQNQHASSANNSLNQSSSGLGTSTPKNQLNFSSCRIPNNVLGVTRNTQEDELPEIPPEYQTSRYIRMNPTTDETSLMQYNKNVHLRDMMFQNDCQLIQPQNSMQAPNHDQNKGAYANFKSIKLEALKVDNNDCQLVFQFRPDKQTPSDQNVNITPKFTSESKPISWFQHLKDYFYAAQKQDTKKYHGYLQIPMCIAENDKKNSAVCDLPKSLLKYKKSKEKRTGIVRKMYAEKPDEGCEKEVRLCLSKNKDRLILCEPTEVCCEINAPQCPQDCSKKRTDLCYKIQPPECQNITQQSDEVCCKLKPPEFQHVQQASAEICCKIKSPECPNENPQNCKVFCEAKKPVCEPSGKKCTYACREDEKEPKHVKSYSETCIKIQQTKTEEVPRCTSAPVSTTCTKQVCLPKPNECIVECKSSSPPKCSAPPSPCPPASSAAPPACPPPPCQTKPKCEKETLLTKIKNYFKARPNCPPPDEWKKKSLQQKAEKAAHKAGLVVIDPRMLPPEIRECVCDGKLDIEMCKEVCDEVPACPEKTKCTSDCVEPKKCCGSSSEFNRNQPISCCNRSDFGKRCSGRKISTMVVQARFYCRNFTMKNLDEINRILEEEEHNKKRKWFDELYDSSNCEHHRCHELKVRNVENHHDEDQFSGEEYKNYLFKRKHRINSYGQLVKTSDVSICDMNDELCVIPSRENILQKVLHISMSDFRAKMRMDLYNLVEETVESKNSLSVEEWESLKTQDVLRALDALLKKNISEED